MKTLLLSILLVLMSGLAFADPPTWDQEIADISRSFDAAAFGMEPGDARKAEMGKILARVLDLQKRFPNRGLTHAWLGWLKFEEMSGMTDYAAMMPMLQEGLKHIEGAIAMEPACCGPEPYINLATVYQIPFTGKDQSETVRKNFAKALEMDPKGLVINTRYAQYLMRAGDYNNALKHVNAAIASPPLAMFRPGQDKAVREEAQDLVEQINDRMKRANETNAAK